MKYQEIDFKKLKVNPSNDRHGPTPTEDTAIMWLFQNKSAEMKRLAENISAAGQIYDSPLVMPEGSSFLVKDGNRRVTCLKLIHDPSQAPDQFRNFFSQLHEESAGRLAKSVLCQIETDVKVADEIIGLRHNGKQSGAGQLKWGPREKANHANRIAGKSDYEWPQLVEHFLETNGHTVEAAAIKRSTLDRVLGAKKRRERLGIGQDVDGNIVSRKPDHDLLPLFLKFARDMKNDKLTLKETLVSKDVDKYLDRLQSLGFLPDSTTIPKPPSPTTSRPRPSPTPKPPKPQKTLRLTLIPSNIPYGIDWTNGQSKIETCWSQLQFELEFKKHKFSIAVVFRVLLEMIAKSFLDKNQMADKGGLAKNLKSVLAALVENKKIPSKEATDIQRIFEDKTSLTSIENLQRILHSKSQMPSEDDLITMWDCLEPFILEALTKAE